MRPTPKEIKEARRILRSGDAVQYNDDVCIGTEDIEAIRTLLAATEPPTDEEVLTVVLAEIDVDDHGTSFESGALSTVRAFLGKPEAP